jgi:hypothetical protein
VSENVSVLLTADVVAWHGMGQKAHPWPFPWLSSIGLRPRLGGQTLFIHSNSAMDFDPESPSSY